eukprot:GHVU01175774.1.p1 GENE.GHVU01175774.1~~GHVU01175774.1.p1  ORF type:complete len:145 (-),score=4.77 GHVU01175774.1:201-635(-)
MREPADDGPRPLAARFARQAGRQAAPACIFIHASTFALTTHTYIQTHTDTDCRSRQLWQTQYSYCRTHSHPFTSPHPFTNTHIPLSFIHSFHFIHFISFISVIEAAHEHIRIHRIHRSDAKRSDARTANPTIDRSSKRTLLSTL